jgi:hypothetical protein
MCEQKISCESCGSKWIFVGGKSQIVADFYLPFCTIETLTKFYAGIFYCLRSLVEVTYLFSKKVRTHIRSHFFG